MSARNFKSKWVTVLLGIGIVALIGLHLTRGSLHRSQAFPYVWDGGEGGGSRERICHGATIGEECRADATSKSGCRSCCYTRCDYNCDNAMDFFFCVGEAYGHCEGLPERELVRAPWGVLTVNANTETGGCGGSPNRVRSIEVRQAWSIGRALLKLIEAGKTGQAYQLLDQLFEKGQKVVPISGALGGRPNTSFEARARVLGRFVQCYLVMDDRKSAQALLDVGFLEETLKRRPGRARERLYVRQQAARDDICYHVRGMFEAVRVKRNL